MDRKLGDLQQGRHVGQPIESSLTAGVSRCQIVTSSRSAASSRHWSDTPRTIFSQATRDTSRASRGTRVQFPPPPFLIP